MAHDGKTGGTLDTERGTTEPQGVIAIMTAPDGEVIATASDFNKSGMGGCKLWEAQMWRAGDAVKWQAVRAYCSDVVFNSIDTYLCGRIAEALCNKGGHKIRYRAVGYSEDATATVKAQRG